MAYKKKTAEERAKEIEELTQGLEDKINSYFVSSEKLQEHLNFMSNFHKYSVRNMALIDNQFSGAKAVGSFQYWKDKGVSVKKGEKGIKILVPTPVQYFSRNNKDVQVKYATPDEKRKIASGEISTERKLFFKIGHVFEYTQTNAREKGLEVSELFSNYHRDGSIENDEQFMKAFGKIADKLGVELLDEPPFNYEFGTAKGGYFRDLNAIALNPRNTAAENISVMIHELAHSDLHNHERNNQREKELTTNEKEFQAEMVAYTVSSHYGIDSESFSVPYLAGWTKNATINDKANLLNEVRQTANDFIQTIDEHFLEFEQFKEKLNNMALESYEKENEPQLFIYDVSTEFERFGKVNNFDFQNENKDNISYAVVFNENDKLQVVHGSFNPNQYVHPLHHMKNNSLVSENIYKELERNFHDELIEVEKIEGVDRMSVSENEFEFAPLEPHEEAELDEILAERQLELTDGSYYEDRLQNELGQSHPDYEMVTAMGIEERTEYFKQADERLPYENQHNHTMQIKNVEGLSDVDEVAKIVITNGVSGKEHELSVWANDAANNELAPYYVYMNMPGQIDLENHDTYSDALSDNLHDGQLFEIINHDDEIEQAINDFHEGSRSDFNFNIPIEQQKMNVHEIVIDEELSDILIKSENGLLEKSDLVNFGKLVNNDLNDLNFKFDENLKKYFDNALSDSHIKNDEKPYLKASYESLDMKILDDFSKNKKTARQEVEYGLER